MDNNAYGIKITMFDYAYGKESENNYKSWKNYGIKNEAYAYLGATDTAPMTTGLVKNTLGTDGYPVLAGTANATYGENTSLKPLFSSTQGHETDANHLFIKSIHDSTGYFEYSSFDNYAYLTSSGDFRVYKDVGSPLGYENEQAYSMYFQRGNFMPFNDISILDKSDAINYTLTDSNGYPLNPEDPNYGEPVYFVNGKPNYYNGMKMEANFYQTKDGIKHGEETIFKFNGDDDMWIFVDGVLLVDLGGTHDARDVQINFSTGEITYGVGGGTLPQNIRQAFYEAGKLPDGTDWPKIGSKKVAWDATNNAVINRNFRGNTLADYTSHSFKMFYMERGAGASNLHMRFNLSTVPEGGFIVEKQLTGDYQKDYGDPQYPFQAFASDGIPCPREITIPHGGETGVSGAWDETLTAKIIRPDGTEVSLTYQDVTINGTSYSNVFYLRPGEKAWFPVANMDTYHYYVKELNMDAEACEVYFNDIESEPDGSNVVQSGTYSARTATVCENRLKKTASLTITKENVHNGVADPVYSTVVSDDTFSFYVFVADNNGVLKPYSGGVYYVQDQDNNYYQFVNNQLTQVRPNSTIKTEANVSSENGKITGIPENYKITIEGFLPGTNFRVVEADVPLAFELDSYTVSTGTTVTLNKPDTITQATDTNEAGVYGALPTSGDLIGAITVTNKVKKADVKIKKVDDEDNSLIGAQFQLSYHKKSGENYIDEIIASINMTSAAEYTISNLPCEKLYKLTETHAPDGYNRLTSVIYFTIDGKGKVKLCNEAGETQVDSQDVKYNCIEVTEESGIYVISVTNTPGARLPDTGGAGTTLHTILGGLLLLIAAALLIKRYSDEI